MAQRITIMLIVAFLLVGCTISNEVETVTTATTVEPTKDKPMQESQEQPKSDIEPTSTASASSSQPGVSGSAVSGPAASVDLANLTPQSPLHSEAVEAPAPGLPNPTPKLIRDVKLDLASQKGIDISDVETVSIEPMVWPDDSLGCPGILTPSSSDPVTGYRIEVAIDGVLYIYHSQDTTSFIPCPSPE